MNKDKDKEFERLMTNEKLKDYVLPFGKFKDKSLDQIPLKYLDWLVGQDWLAHNTKVAIIGYLSEPVIKRELKAELDQQ